MLLAIAIYFIMISVLIQKLYMVEEWAYFATNSLDITSPIFMNMIHTFPGLQILGKET